MRRPLTYALWLFAAAFAVRAALVLLLRDPFTGPAGGPTDDDVEFDALARNVASGLGFVNHGRPTSFRAPGWPWLLAGVYATVGAWPVAVYVLNCALGASSCVLAYLIGRDLLDEKAARRAGWLAAFFLPHAWFATLYYSENLFVPLLGLAAWQLPRRPGLSGLALGAAILTRPFALLLVPLWAGWPLRQPPERRLLKFLLFVSPSIVGIALWMERNEAVHGRPVLIATNGGSTFYGGNNDKVATEWRLWGSWVSTTELPGRDQIEAAPDEVSHDREEWRLGIRWVWNNPGRFAWLLPMKLARLIVWLPDFDAGRLFYVVRFVCWVPYLVLLIVGLWNAPRTGGWWVLHLALAATALTALIFWGSPRFRDANAPLLMTYASLGWGVLAREPTRLP